MPFQQVTPRPFSSRGIQMYAPMASGVYGISSSREWLYIGESDDIQMALQELLEDGRDWLMKRSPTGFVFEVCEGARRVSRQERLVFEYGPFCNRQPSPGRHVGQ
jgi:hypothetical protein